MFIDHLGDRGHSHMLSHQDDQRIQKQSESAAFSRPRNLNLFYSAVFAFCPRNAAMDIGFKLKEVQVTPGSFDSIMHIALWLAAFCTRKFAAGFKIYMNIELLAFGTKIY
jgi:hypothetical protein